MALYAANNICKGIVKFAENGEKVGIIRAEDVLHTYRFNAESKN